MGLRKRSSPNGLLEPLVFLDTAVFNPWQRFLTFPMDTPFPVLLPHPRGQEKQLRNGALTCLDCTIPTFKEGRDCAEWLWINGASFFFFFLIIFSLRRGASFPLRAVVEELKKLPVFEGRWRFLLNPCHGPGAA